MLSKLGSASIIVGLGGDKVEACLPPASVLVSLLVATAPCSLGGGCASLLGTCAKPLSSRATLARSHPPSSDSTAGRLTFFLEGEEVLVFLRRVGRFLSRRLPKCPAARSGVGANRAC